MLLLACRKACPSTKTLSVCLKACASTEALSACLTACSFHEALRYKIPCCENFLLDDFERVAFVGPDSGGVEQGAQGAGGAALASNDLAHVVLSYFQFNHVAVDLIYKNFVGSVHE